MSGLLGREVCINRKQSFARANGKLLTCDDNERPKQITDTTRVVCGDLLSLDSTILRFIVPPSVVLRLNGKKI